MNNQTKIRFETIAQQMQVVLSNIKTIRTAKNYSQDYMAIKLCISQNGYSKLELGYSKMSIDMFFNVADILEADPMALLKK